jgi:uncharacterized protein YkwD
MLRRPAALLFLVILQAGCSLPIGGLPLPPAGPAATPGPDAGAPHRALEAEIHALVNAERVARGLRPLRYDEQLAAIARKHSEEMAAGRRPFGHGGFEARSAAIRQIIRFRSFAENVAYDSRGAPADRIVVNWIRSEGHFRNIVGTFELTGIGVARANDGLFYATQLFVLGP